MRKQPIPKKSFAKIHSASEIPDLLDIQIRSFKDFLQDDIFPDQRKSQGLQEVFLSLFPVTDSRENYLLEFVEYYVDSPKYSMEENGLFYAALKTGAPIMAAAWYAKNVIEFKSWDNFILPLPFCKVAYLWGEPLFVPGGVGKEGLEKSRLLLQERMRQITEEADRIFQKKS